MVLWELVTLAQQPYQGMPNEEVLNFVKNGNTEKVPSGTPEIIANLMRDCWRFEASDRPTFIGNFCQFCSSGFCGAGLCGVGLCGAGLCGAGLYGAGLCGVGQLLLLVRPAGLQDLPHIRLRIAFSAFSSSRQNLGTQGTELFPHDVALHQMLPVSPSNPRKGANECLE